MTISSVKAEPSSAPSTRKDKGKESTSSFPSYKKVKPSLSSEIQEAALALIQDALDEEKLLAEGNAQPPFTPTTPAYFSSEILSSVTLSAEIGELFEKSVNALAHLTSQGISETTFYLENSQFAGAKIVITEFNTAPKAFNIAFVGAPEAAALFALHAHELLSALQKSPFNFTVHRLDTDIELHLFQRKEEISDQKEDEESR